jgi:hypothetical protein
MTEVSDSIRLHQYAALNDRIAESLPLIPLFHDQVTHFVRQEVEGWEINSVNRLDLRRVRKSSAPTLEAAAGFVPQGVNCQARINEFHAQNRLPYAHPAP